MRLLFRSLIVLLILAAIGYGVSIPLRQYLAQRNKPQFRQVEIDSGTIRYSVNATGKIKPKLSVQIGSFVSGPIIELNVDFNAQVKKGDLLARIDPRIYQAAKLRDEAALATRKADAQRVEALLQQARNDEERAIKLYEEDEDFISDTERDRLRFNRMSLEAQLVVAEAAIQQAMANLENSQANLDYTRIVAPSDGTLIDRKIDPGQTLTAQFQTPELFVLGVDMQEEMHINASIDESDIGLIREAERTEQPVYFRVDAYPDELFEGKIKEIRMNSMETQNVTTYPVIVTTANPELKLLPGMTAYLTFQIEVVQDCLRIPWAAVRYLPDPELVREQDRPLLRGGGEAEDQQDQPGQADVPELVEANRERLRRHVWTLDGEKLRAVSVTLGVSDYRYAQLLDGDIVEGQQIVTGVQSDT